MKKLLILTFILFLSSSIASATVLKTNAETKRIAAGTEFKIKLNNPIGTKTSDIGEYFSATLVNDIKDTNKTKQVILPAGSMIRGCVLKVTPAKRLSRGGILYLEFDHIVTPTGIQLPLKLTLASKVYMRADGGFYLNKGYGEAIQDNWSKTVDITTNATEWGMDVADLGDEWWQKSGRVLTVPTGAIGGAIGGGFYWLGDSVADMFKKGQDVEFNQGEVINTLLTQPIDVPTK